MQEELEEEFQQEEAEEIVSNDKEEDVATAIPASEAKRLQAMQEEFISKHKRVQIAECIFVYEKKDEQ